jgi:ribosome-associated protein
MKHDATAKEQSLNPTRTVPPEVKAIPRGESGAELDDRILTALQAASDKKATESVVLDLREIASFTDYFVITSGTNERQVQAISDEVLDKLKKAGTAAARVEGYKSAEWILLDYGDFIVHVFVEKARKFYDLERLWRESSRIEIPPELGDEKSGSLRSES